MQVSKRLIVRKEIPIENPLELLNSIDTAMAKYYCQNNNHEKNSYKIHLVNKKETVFFNNIFIFLLNMPKC